MAWSHGKVASIGESVPLVVIPWIRGRPSDG